MISYVKALVFCMFGLLYREAPAIEHSTKPAHIQHREDVQVLGSLFYNTGSQGALVSPDVDPLILAAMSWEESRYRQYGADGDPRFVNRNTRAGSSVVTCKTEHGKTKCDGAASSTVVRIGQSIGPMQISRGATTWITLWEKTAPEDVAPFRGLTIEQLRDPSTNVSFAYMLLKKFKRECGGPPAAWIDAYGRGHCASRTHFGAKAKLRCKRVDSFLVKMREQYPQLEVPEGFVCTKWTATG